MIAARLSLVFNALALTISLALAADWLAAWWFDVGSIWARGCLLIASLSMGGVWLAVQHGRQRAVVDSTLAHLDKLGHFRTNRLVEVQVDPRLRDLLPRRWFKASRRLTKRLAMLSRRIEELERERADYKSRARRYEAQMQRIHSILSALGEPVLVIDKRDQLVLTNHSADALFSLGAEQPQRRAIDSLIECERLVELLVDTRRCRRFTERSCELEIADPQGEPRWYRVTARNIPTQPGQSDPDNTSQGVVALLHDISAQKTLQKRNAELVSAVSHAMKTPLAGIKAYLELLADGDAADDATEQQFLEVIAEEGDRLQRLVDNLVELARIEADLAGTAKQLLPLDAALDDALREIGPAAAARRVSLVRRLDSGACVLADRGMVVRAAIHLLSNAVKFTPADGRITVRSFAAGSETGFEVEDTGIGMSREECRKVFDKFYRAARPENAAGGTGLGLALVKHVVQDVHAGRIEVTSAPGVGSTFRVVLPSAANPSPGAASPLKGRKNQEARS